jgi:hypothetical protein
VCRVQRGMNHEASDCFIRYGGIRVEEGRA